MGEPRADKVAVVAEVKEKLEASDGVMLTEYRGMDVPAMAELRQNLAPAGGEYKIYKNTLVRLAANELGLELDELLVGPTALAFVGEKADGSAGDSAAVAKALRDYSKTNEALVIKGGLLDGKSLSQDEIKALADLPSREVLFAEFAGAMEYMLGDFAGLLENKLREFVYAMEELVEKGGPGGTGTQTEAAAAEAAAPAEDSADEAPADSGEVAASEGGEVAASDSGEVAASDSDESDNPTSEEE
ncbi:MAG: 50S ribosomal protein L10 [Acidimicrobiales bacterium]